MIITIINNIEDMFSGIIQAIVPVHTIYEGSNFKTCILVFPQHMLSNIKIGSSIANNGCCLTVVDINYNLVSFNLINSTLKSTNMNMLKIGDFINIERSMLYQDRIDGHLMTGHIDCTGKIKKVINFNQNKIIWIEIIHKYFQKYIILKGSIGIDGVSLTINKISNNYIQVCLTPYTAQKTTLGTKTIGNIVNIETDFLTKAIVNTTEKILSKINIIK